MRRRARELVKTKATVLTESGVPARRRVEGPAPRFCSALRQWGATNKGREEGSFTGWAEPRFYRCKNISEDMAACEPGDTLEEDSPVAHSLVFHSPLFDFFSLNTKVNNAGQGAPRSVHTDVYSDIIPQTTALSRLQVEEWTAKTNCSCWFPVGYLHKY